MRQLAVNKRIVVGLSIMSIVTVGVAAAAFLWQTETGTIDYWLNDTIRYQLINDQWETVDYSTNATSSGLTIPVYCRNDGTSPASFSLTILFTNAVYKGSPAIPGTIVTWEAINDTAANYSFNLSPNEMKSIDVSFMIENNTESFTIRLLLDSNQNLRAEPAQKGSQPWQTVYRTLYFGQIEKNVYTPAHIS